MADEFDDNFEPELDPDLFDIEDVEFDEDFDDDELDEDDLEEEDK